MQKINNTYDSNQTYFDEIYNKYDKFYSKLDLNNVEPENIAAYTIASGYKILLDFIKINPSSYEFSNENIIDIYLEEGANRAYMEMDELLSKIPTENYYGQQFYDAKSVELENTLSYLDAIDTEGCIKDGEIDGECTSVIEGETDLSVHMSESYNTTYALLNNFYNNIGLNCLQLRNAMLGEYQS